MNKTEINNVVILIFSIAFGILIVIGGVQVIDRFTRVVITAEDKAKIIEAQTKQYIEKFNLCAEAKGEWKPEYGGICEIKNN